MPEPTIPIELPTNCADCLGGQYNWLSDGTAAGSLCFAVCPKLQEGWSCWPGTAFDETKCAELEAVMPEQLPEVDPMPEQLPEVDPMPEQLPEVDPMPDSPSAGVTESPTPAPTARTVVDTAAPTPEDPTSGAAGGRMAVMAMATVVGAAALLWI